MIKLHVELNRHSNYRGVVVNRDGSSRNYQCITQSSYNRLLKMQENCRRQYCRRLAGTELQVTTIVL
jgi:hypothetical protein